MIVADDFGYLDARVRARRAELLPEGFFTEALRVNFADFLRLLAETPYGAHLAGEGLADVDRAVAAYFDARVADLPALASGDAARALRLLFLRADLVNLKAILRAKQAGRPLEEVRARLAGGTLPRPLLEALLEAPDLASMAQLMVLPGHPLAAAMRAAARVGDPLRAEVVLDRAFFAAVLKEAREIGGLLADYFQLEVDLTNLGTALKLAAMGMKEGLEDYYVPGGRYVTPALFHRIAQGEPGALAELADTPLAPVAQAQDLKTFERAARCLLLALAAKGRYDVLGPGLALDFVRRKEWEAARIRLAARRAYYNLPPEAIEEEVVCS